MNPAISFLQSAHSISDLITATPDKGKIELFIPKRPSGTLTKKRLAFLSSSKKLKELSRG